MNFQSFSIVVHKNDQKLSCLTRAQHIKKILKNSLKYSVEFPDQQQTQKIIQFFSKIRKIFLLKCVLQLTWNLIEKIQISCNQSLSSYIFLIPKNIQKSVQKKVEKSFKSNLKFLTTVSNKVSVVWK
jgi:ABC-type maltose transport system permease subunit